jgi:hypothetical protein
MREFMPRLDLDPGDFDAESGLPGPAAFVRGVEREFDLRRRLVSKLDPAIGVIRVERINPVAARAVAETIKQQRRCFDMAGRLDERTFAIVLGSYFNATPPFITELLPILEAVAHAAADNGAGNVRARTFWLKSEHGSAEEWFREATRWHE